jgi:uncharacterized protein (TIGR03435 family)
MMRATIALVALLAAVSPLAAQAPPRFEVASIKPSLPEPPPPGTAGGLRITEGQARFSYMSLKDYIGLAYGVRVYQIVAPDWIAGARFEIIATIPEDQRAKDVTKMMAALLEERFHLTSHRETREFPAYALETLPGFRLEPVTADAPAGAFTVTSTNGPTGSVVALGDGASLEISSNKLEFKKVTFAQLAGVVERFVDRPVIDQSKREGRFTITLDLMPEDFQAAIVRSAINAGVSLPAPALRVLETSSSAAVPDALKTLGVSLQQWKLPMEVIVIDSVDRMPTEN